MKALRSAVPWLGTALALLALATPVTSQVIGLEVVPKVGVFTPLGALTGDAEIEPALALGLAAEFRLPRLPVSVRANLDYANTTEIDERSEADARIGEVNILNAVADLVLRPFLGTAFAQPYVLAGAGIKRYDITLDEGAGGSLAGIERFTTRFTLHVGGGLDVRLGVVTVVLEIADYLSAFPGPDGARKTQNDLYGMAGFRVRF